MIALPVIDAMTLVRPAVVECFLCDGFRLGQDCGARAVQALEAHLVHAHGDGIEVLP